MVSADQVIEGHQIQRHWNGKIADQQGEDDKKNHMQLGRLNLLTMIR
jgi:hypothetical protein